MDAPRPAGRLLLALPALLALSGCTWNPGPPRSPRPVVRPETTEPEEPPQVVADVPPLDMDAEVDRNIQTYIQRVEDARRLPDPPTDSQPSAAEPLPAEPGPLPPAATEPADAPPEWLAGPMVLLPEQTPASAEPTAPAVDTPPPQLTGVSIRADSGFEARPEEAGSPVPNAATAARTAPASLRDFLERMVPPAEGSFREQLDVRMLRVIAGDYERAREPLALVTAEQQELATRFIDAWIAVREGHMGDLAGAANAASRELAELQETLRRLGDLSVPAVRLCSAVRGFGQYDELDPPRFAAGATAEFVLYCEVRDFVSELREGWYHTRFDLTTTILNRGGESVLELRDSDVVDRCRNRRQDCFIPRLVRLPATLSPGEYVAKATVVDKLGHKLAEGRATFQVVARP